MVPRIVRLLCGRPLPGAVRRGLVMVVLLSLACVPAASAQHIRGRLLDVVTNHPIASGLVTLLSADSSIAAATMSDAAGQWRLEVPRAGVYHVAAERMGYRSWVSGPVEVGPDDELNAEYHLEPVAVRLDPIEVRAEAVRQYLEYTGFFERQHGNFGHFVTPEAIEKRQAARVTDLLTAIPGVQQVAVTGGSVGPVHIQLRGSNLSHGGLCRPRIFVDGLMYSRGDSRPVRLRSSDATERAVEERQQRLDQALSLDDIGHPSTIAAIEVYRSASQVPAQFGGTSVETLCGVIVVWTHTGRTRVGRNERDEVP